MNSKEIREHKKDLKLTKRQRQIIAGLLLGDGHLETRDNGRTYRLKVEHGERQQEYVQWLFEELKDLVGSEEPYKKVATADSRKVSYGFTSYSLGILRFYGQQFYSQGQKVIPRKVNKLLSPLSVAIWFMDDGSKKSSRHNTYIIHSLGFRRAELERVCVALEKVFGIHAVLHKQKQHYWRIYIPSESAQTFKSLIERYVTEIPSMTYKL